MLWGDKKNKNNFRTISNICKLQNCINGNLRCSAYLRTLNPLGQDSYPWISHDLSRKYFNLSELHAEIIQLGIEEVRDKFGLRFLVSK